MNIKDQLTADAEIVETALEQYLSAQDDDFPVLFDAMRYAVLGGGKRIRAFLTIEFCRMMNKDITPAVPFAAAVEMVHAMSLIQDDMPCMDDDDMRRGKKATHIEFGETNALLASDGLLVLAFETISSNLSVRPRTALRAVSEFAALTGAFGLFGGQTLDLIGETKKLDAKTLKNLHLKKTGALIKASCILGCYASEHYDDALIKSAIIYAENIGLAFQIIDDILDATGDEAVLGKHIGKDKESGKTTFLTEMSISQAREYAAELTKTACDEISKYKNSENLVQLAEFLIARQK